MKSPGSATITIRSQSPTPGESEKDKTYGLQDKHTNARELYRPALSFPSKVIKMLNKTKKKKKRKNEHE